MAKELPKELFIVRDTEDDYLDVRESADEFAEIGKATTAGVYELKRQVSITARVELRQVEGMNGIRG